MDHPRQQLLNAVLDIARSATAHNPGGAILSSGVNLEGDAVSITFSSWPRMMEAWKALESHGYRLDHLVGEPNTLQARGRQVADVPADRSTRTVEAWLARS